MLVLCLVLRSTIAVADQNQSASSLPLRLEVRLNKSVYIVGEPIIVNLKITNLGTETVEGIWFSYVNTLRYEIRTVKGENLVPLFVYYSFYHRDVTLWRRQMQPQDAVTTAMDVMLGDIVEVSPDYERVEFHDSQMGQASTHLKEGVYSIEVSHKLPKPLKGLMSATAKFQVRQPTEREKVALGLFHPRPYEVYNHKAQVIKTKTAAIEECLVSYQQLCRDYPDTVYAPYAAYYIGRLWQNQQKWADAITQYESILRKYPAFPLKADLLYYLCACYLDSMEKNQARQLFHELKREFPDHLSAPTVTYVGDKSRLDALEANVAK